MQAKATPDVMSAPAETPPRVGVSRRFGTRTEARASSRWIRFAVPTLADALFVVVLLRGLPLGVTGYFNDPGTGWHLRTGAEIVATGRVPVIDTFSHTRSGAAWVETQWLADSVMHLTFSIAGYGLLALCTAIVLAGLFRWIYRTHLSYHGWPVVSLAVTLTAACAASGHFLARPLLASTIGIPLSFWWATEFARGRLSARRLWWLVPIAVLWTNLHPGVLGGIATVGLCGVGLSVQWLISRRLVNSEGCHSEQREEAGGIPGKMLRSAQHDAGAFLVPQRELMIGLRRRAITLLTVSVAMGAATLINPYGIAWHGWVARIMDMPTLAGSVQEWMPPVWTAPDTIAAMALVAVAVVGVLVRRTGVRVAEGLVIVFWAAQGFQSYRHLPVMSLIVALQLGRVLSDVRITSPVLQRIGRRIPVFGQEMRTAEVRTGGGPASVAVVVLLMLCLVTGTSIAGVTWDQAGPPERRYSAGVVRFLRDNPPEGPIFNALILGGQLIREVPGSRVFIDDRFGLYGARFVQDYIAAVSEPAERLGELLDRWEMGTAVVLPGTAVDRYLSSAASWTERYRDSAACVYTRPVPPVETPMPHVCEVPRW